MVWGTEWTGDRVAERLAAVFRELPNTPIYSPRKSVSEPSHPRRARADHRRAIMPRARDADLLPALAVGKDAVGVSP
jgi:hypothetical protein